MSREIWLGSEGSYIDLQLQLAKAEFRSDWDDEDSSSIPHQIVDGVGIMSIKGPLVATANWMTRWLGIPSYDDIKQKAAELAGNEKVRVILATYDTPGGDAKGCKNCANYLQQLSDTVKPIVSYTEGTAASAGYWLFAAGQQGVTSEDGRLGSIGAIIVHQESSQMHEKLGITFTVKRSAPYKALGTPYEKLTEAAHAELDAELEYLHNTFVKGIAELRDIDETKVASTIANGKMYRAAEAKKLGMVDTILSFEDTVVKLATQYKPKRAK